MEEFDYIVVGAGSAGCVLAARLSEDSSVSVLVLDAGNEDRHLAIGIPAAFPTLFSTGLDWADRTEPQAAISGRKVYWPRGKVLGGSSSINAMMWIRGFRSDYDSWGEIAGPQWRYDAVLEYFQRAEAAESSIEGTAHGRDGPLLISAQRDPNPLTLAWLDACKSVGIGPNVQQNSGEESGVAMALVNQRHGRRMSVADAYLAPVRHRRNLTVRPGAKVDRVVFDTSRATGVAYRSGRGRHEVGARREVLLAAGAVGSPQLLLLSGVGPADALTRLGIAVVADRQAVGQNLADHLTAGFALAAKRPVTLGGARGAGSVLRYLFGRHGLLSSNIAEGYGFVRSDPRLSSPDLELIFVPGLFIDEGLTVPKAHGVTLAAVLLEPKSRGEVRLHSSDPDDPPAIDPRYLSDNDGADEAVLRRGVRICQEIVAAAPLADEVGAYVQPAGLVGEALVDASLRRYAQSLYHPVGTCAMGSGSESVVDPHLVVRGVSGLRVIDASVIPLIPHGHTNAAVVMVAERAAEEIRRSR